MLFHQIHWETRQTLQFLQNVYSNRLRILHLHCLAQVSQEFLATVIVSVNYSFFGCQSLCSNLIILLCQYHIRVCYFPCIGDILFCNHHFRECSQFAWKLGLSSGFSYCHWSCCLIFPVRSTRPHCRVVAKKSVCRLA